MGEGLRVVAEVAAGRRVEIVQGLQDRAAPPENGRLLERERPAPTTRVEVDGAGHALLPEQPVAVATQVVRFLHDVEA